MTCAVQLEAPAALLEQAYRTALQLQEQCAPGPGPVVESGFAARALATELVALLDEARVALLAAARSP